MSSTNMQNTFERMNAMYRHQRFFYDATRKYYLLGRDKLISQLKVRPGERILEVGCGTSRNLIILAQKYPDTQFFGLDASSEMLRTAQNQIDSNRIPNIALKTALADDFHYRDTFDLEEPFDTIFFSYSISMIPTWEESIANALNNLKPSRSIHIVDFYDQQDLPGWFRGLLKTWLSRFHVQFWRGLLPHLRNLENKSAGTLEIMPIARRYAFLARFEKTA